MTQITTLDQFSKELSDSHIDYIKQQLFQNCAYKLNEINYLDIIKTHREVDQDEFKLKKLQNLKSYS